MNRIARVAFVGLFSLTACGGPTEKVRSFKAAARMMNVNEVNGARQYNMMVQLTDEASGAVTEHPAVGWRSAPKMGVDYTWRLQVDGEAVVIEHEDALKEMIVTVGSHDPVHVRQNLDGLYDHGGQSFQDSESGRAGLAASVAASLKSRSIDPEAAAATGAAYQEMVDYEIENPSTQGFILPVLFSTILPAVIKAIGAQYFPEKKQ